MKRPDLNEARDRTVATWVGIRDRIAVADPDSLLFQINAVTDLCRAGEEVAGSVDRRCEFCPLYDQVGGCQELTRRMNHCVLEHDRERLRRIVDRFLEQLRGLKLGEVETDQVSVSTVADSEEV